MARRGNGRQRVIMEIVKKESARQVTFSKRRVGLLKKGSELCTLCGAEVVIVVFSPGGKVFSFGHPSAEGIISRFLDEEPKREQGTDAIVHAHRCSRQSELNFHLTQLESLIDVEKRKGEEIDQERQATEGKVWWEKPIEELTVEQLELLMLKMREFKEYLKEEACLLQQTEGEGYNDHGPFNVIGTGSYGGSAFDLKGKGPTNTVPSNGASFDPRVRNSSSLRIPGFSDGVAYSPMMIGSISHIPPDPRMAWGRVPFDPMVVGSSSQVPLDSRTLQYYHGLSYDAMPGGSSGARPSDQMVFGSANGGGRSLNHNPLGFQGGDRIDPNASGPRNGGDWSFL